MVVIAGFFSTSSIQHQSVFLFIIIFGVAFFYVLLDRLDLQARLYLVALKCLLVALTFLPLGLRILPPHAKQPYPPYFPPIISRVSDMLSPREIICTDMPWATAWYGDKISILLPKNIDQYYEIILQTVYKWNLFYTNYKK